jgi:hypothetical protein
MKTFDKIISIFDNINSLIIFFLTIVATVATVRSCQISKDIQTDERQLNTLKTMMMNQQGQLNTQRAELSEINTQTGIISKEYFELKNVDSGMAVQNKKISNQLAISQEQERVEFRTSYLERKANIMRLRIMHHQLIEIIVAEDYIHFTVNDLEQSLDLLDRVGKLLEGDMRNPVLLEDDSISFKWIDLYSNVGNARIAFNTQPNRFSITKKINGKEITSNTEVDLQEYKQNAYNQFAKSLSNFSFYFTLFMQKRSKEINLNFE